MAAGFPLKVNGLPIRTSEALYQACRFPHLPEVQQLIIDKASPMTAKMESKPYRNKTRPDWDQVRVEIMRWCLRVKLAQNWEKFSVLLLAAGERPIVEKSRRDAFWGAKIVDEQTLVGMNILGCLLMELREAVKSSDRNSFLSVEPLTIPNFRLMGQSIQSVVVEDVKEEEQTEHISVQETPSTEPKARIMQTSMIVMQRKTKIVTLTIEAALKEAGFSDCINLPQTIFMEGFVRILSEKRDCYYTVTPDDCSCIDFVSGKKRPCKHQLIVPFDDYHIDDLDPPELNDPPELGDYDFLKYRCGEESDHMRTIDRGDDP